MAINFNELTKTTVHIGIGDGKYVEVPMLTVEDYAEMQQLQRTLTELSEKKDATQTQRVDAIMEGRDKLAAMAMKVMPQELHNGLKRMDYMTLLKLVTVLCNGKDEGEKDDPQKKTVMPSQKPQM
jgi:hypothetical protein